MNWRKQLTEIFHHHGERDRHWPERLFWATIAAAGLFALARFIAKLLEGA